MSFNTPVWIEDEEPDLGKTTLDENEEGESTSIENDEDSVQSIQSSEQDFPLLGLNS